MSDDPNLSSQLSEEDLEELRQKIDAVDKKLIEIVNERAELVVDVGKIKRKSGTPIYAPHREQAVLRKVQELNQGPLAAKTVEALYRELMSGSFHLEQPLRIGFLGPIGSYSQLAATRHFGSSVAYEDLRAVEGVFTEVVRGRCDYGLVPIENTTGGGIAETMDAFTEHHENISIYAEVQLEVKRCLLANCKPNEIRKIYARPDSMVHCRKWLATQFPQVELVNVDSGGTAARMASEDYEADPECGVAGIGSELAGEMYGLHVLFSGIEDNPNNITRFLVLSKQHAGISNDDKTSMMFVTPDRPGALVDVLSVFKRAGINLTHIDKRPSRRMNWEYTFFIDAEGHRDDPAFAEVIGEARAFCRELTVLGSYPRSQRLLS
ncbi:MAG: prephenate dehydratase [Planctomycetota bacterium]|nr:prephenate dehydratase [Planctomycetota bacterium]